jgi:hypothetical protein
MIQYPTCLRTPWTFLVTSVCEWLNPNLLEDRIVLLNPPLTCYCTPVDSGESDTILDPGPSLSPFSATVGAGGGVLTFCRNQDVATGRSRRHLAPLWFFSGWPHFDLNNFKSGSQWLQILSSSHWINVVFLKKWIPKYREQIKPIPQTLVDRLHVILVALSLYILYVHDIGCVITVKQLVWLPDI